MTHPHKHPSSSSATAPLRDDHETILSMLEVIERTVALLEDGQAVEAWVLDGLLEFLRVFVDRCHHGKEETVLFPALEANGIPRAGGPIGVMLGEHERGRDFVQRMEEAARAYATGTTTAGRDYAAIATRYAELVRQHIHKENNILFAMADACISAEEQLELAAGYDRIEAQRMGPGAYQRLHAKMEQLRSTVIRG